MDRNDIKPANPKGLDKAIQIVKELQKEPSQEFFDKIEETDEYYLESGDVEIREKE